VTVDARFCPRCGTALPGRPPTTCTACGYALFVNPRPTGTVVIVKDDRFLGILRAREPQSGRWDLPGGFCDGWELPAEAAVREAREELNVEVRLGGFIGMYVGRYTFQEEVLPILDCFWFASIVDGDLRLDPAEASEWAWLSLADPPPLAFVTTERAIADARACLEQFGPGN
jgi:8-oxo-dGTP diphosphatase